MSQLSSLSLSLTMYDGSHFLCQGWRIQAPLVFKVNSHLLGGFVSLDRVAFTISIINSPTHATSLSQGLPDRMISENTSVSF